MRKGNGKAFNEIGKGGYGVSVCEVWGDIGCRNVPVCSSGGSKPGFTLTLRQEQFKQTTKHETKVKREAVSYQAMLLITCTLGVAQMNTGITFSEVFGDLAHTPLISTSFGGR